MKRKILIWPLIIMICLSAGFLLARYFEKSIVKETEIPTETTPIDNSLTEELGEVEDIPVSKIIHQVFLQSQLGKVESIPFIAGETTSKEVTKLWGESNTHSNTEVGEYIEFPDKDIILGIKNSMVFDIRSYKDDIKLVHLNELKDYREPDETKTYKDETTHQIILIYHENTNYQLKWVFPYPTDENPNPKVHHISVLNLSETMNQTINQQLSNLSLDEKIGQLIFAGISSTELTTSDRKLITQYKVGGIIFYKENLQNPTQILRLLKTIKETNSGNKYPLFLGIDEEGGRISRMPKDIQSLPSSLAIGNSNNVSFAYDIGRILGKELSTFGFNLDFAPVLDINSNPNNPIIGDRSFGNNAEVVSSFGIETMRGLQSENIISVIKHFPGHGDTDVDSHLELPTINKTKKQLEELELIPFKQAIHQNTDTVMIAHILLPKIDAAFPASLSKKIITGILRDEMGYDGVVITDDLTMKAITNNYTMEKAAVESIKAGSDILLIAHDFQNVEVAIQSIKKAIETGEITEEEINTSVKRIIQLKEKYKLNNSNVEKVNIEELNQTINNILNKYQS